MASGEAKSQGGWCRDRGRSQCAEGRVQTRSSYPGVSECRRYGTLCTSFVQEVQGRREAGEYRGDSDIEVERSVQKLALLVPVEDQWLVLVWGVRYFAEYIPATLSAPVFWNANGHPECVSYMLRLCNSLPVPRPLWLLVQFEGALGGRIWAPTTTKVAGSKRDGRRLSVASPSSMARAKPFKATYR